MKFGKYMSRVGKKPILIPSGVQIEIDGSKVTAKGPKGETSRQYSFEMKITQDNGKVIVAPIDERKELEPIWGTTRALLNNMIEGVNVGFEKKLQVEGLGFKVALSGNVLDLQVGFTNPVKVEAPEGVKFSVEKNIITVSGIDLEKVSLLASQIKKIRKPEPYKGAGIRYLGEQIRRKVGKKAVATTK